jgi:hypothetical protein
VVGWLRLRQLWWCHTHPDAPRHACGQLSTDVQPRQRLRIASHGAGAEPTSSAPCDHTLVAVMISAFINLARRGTPPPLPPLRRFEILRPAVATDTSASATVLRQSPARPGKLRLLIHGARGQEGCCRLVMESGTGSRGTSRATLSGGKPFGPDGARRLAELFRRAPPPLLASLDFRN